MKVTGAQALMKCLKEEGVDVVFGLPGGAVIDIFDEILKNKDFELLKNKATSIINTIDDINNAHRISPSK